MRYDDISWMGGINDVDDAKVAALAASMLAEGWKGAPILACEGQGLVTGSHRLAALSEIERMYEDGELEGDAEDRALELLGSAEVAEDVSDLVEAWCEENGAPFDELPCGRLGEVFAGTRVEAYADGLEEW